MLPMETIYSSFRRTKTVQGWIARIAAVAALAVFWALPAYAGSRMSETEYRMLPDYCKAQGNVEQSYFQKYYNPGRAQQWKDAFGSNNFQHFHHYCWSLVAIAQAYSSTAIGSRLSLATGAIRDIEYVLERSSSDFVLLPMIYTKLGEAYLLARDDRNAEAAFRKAWEVDPSYWRPYVWWAGRLKQRGKTREALAVAEEGLKNAPGTKSLQNLIRDLRSTGKKSSK